MAILFDSAACLHRNSQKIGTLNTFSRSYWYVWQRQAAVWLNMRLPRLQSPLIWSDVGKSDTEQHYSCDTVFENSTISSWANKGAAARTLSRSHSLPDKDDVPKA